MPQAWDTTTAARLRPDSLEFDYVTARWQLGGPVAFTATTLNEIFSGLHKATLAGSSGAGAQLGRLRDQIAARLIDVLAFTPQPPHIHADLRARMPTPPTSVAKRSKGRSKAEDRVAWVM